MGTPSTTASDFDSQRRGAGMVVPRWRCILMVVASALVLALVLAPTAPAANKYEYVGRFPPEFGQNQGWSPQSFSSIRTQGLAVSGKNGHIYVADSGRSTIYDFESYTDKVAVAWEGQNTPAGSFGGRVSVAVDNTSGDVYVADANHALILKFDEDGDLLAGFGDTTPAPDGRLSGAETPAGSFSPPTGSESTFALAVNQANHQLYVVDAGHEVIDVFDSTGQYLRQITDTPPGIYSGGGMEMSGLAVSGATGSAFVSDSGSGLVFKFDSLGDYESTWNGKDLPSDEAESPGGGFTKDPLALASADAKQRILIGDGTFYSRVTSFDDAGAFVPPQLEEGNYSLRAIALDPSSEDLYVSSFGWVNVWKPLAVPDVSVKDAGDVKPKSAAFAGHFAPDGGDVTDCHFEYIEDVDYRRNAAQPFNSVNPWTGAEQLPCQTSPASGPPFVGPEDVTAEASGLTPGRIYHMRLVVSAQAANFDVARTFRTPGVYRQLMDLGSSGSGDGELSEPMDVAVDNSTGDVYVADTGNHRVVKFDSSGAFVSAWGWGVADGSPENQVCTSGCQAGLPGGAAGQLGTPRYIEVDNSTGLSAHAVYVADADDRTVQKFTSGGSLETSWANGGTFSLFKEGDTRGITVSPMGSLFVVSGNQPYNLTEIGQDGTQVGQTALGGGFSSPNGGGIEIDLSENLYVTQGSTAEVIAPKYGSHPLYPQGYGDLPNSGFAVDRAPGHVYMAQGDHIDQFIPAPWCYEQIYNGPIISLCGPTDTFGYGELTNAQGLAFEPESRRVLAADSGADRVVVFAPVPMPVAETGPAVAAGSTAELSGSVDPASAGTVTDCHFEYGTTDAYELGDVPCAPEGPTTQSPEVTAPLSGLARHQTYHYRVVAEGPSEVPAYGADRTITVAGVPPSIEGATATSTGRTEATVSANVDPNGEPTVYRFEYGTTTQYESKTAPAGPIDGEGSRSVTASIVGLTPGLTYHFRLVASNFDGQSIGPDGTFDTPDAPSIQSFEVAVTGPTTATATARLSAGFRPTTVRLEYGAGTAYGSSLVDQLAAGDSVDAVQFHLSGLAPGTIHHARLVATNEIGSTTSPDATFSTRPAGRGEETKKPCKRGFVRKRGKCRKRHRGRRHNRHPKPRGQRGSKG